MTLLQQRPSVRSQERERLNRRGSLESREPGRPRRSKAVALVLACLTLMTLDLVGGESSPVDGARRIVGEAYAPVWARQQVMSSLGGRTVEEALAGGVSPKEVWRAVVAQLHLPESER